MEFKKVKLKEIATVNMGQSPKGSSYNDKELGMPFLQGNRTFGRMYPSIDTWTTEPNKIGKKNSILMSVRAPVGDINIANEDICIGRGLCSIEMINGNNQYLYYLLMNSINEIKVKSTGTVFDSINRKELEDIEVLNFSETQQNKLVNILFKIDKKIELNNKIKDNLYNISQQLYKRWFVDFKFPNNSGKYKKTELGNIPESWEIATLSNFSNIKYGRGLPTTNILSEGYLVYGGNGVIGKYSEYMYEEPQILISCRGAASGKVITTRPYSFVTNNSLILECDRINYYYLKEMSLNRQYYSYKTGSAQPQITIDNIKDIKIVKPDKDTLERFNKLILNLDKKLLNLIEENEVLEQLRNTLLPRLINGEIDLDKIEI